MLEDLSQVESMESIDKKIQTIVTIGLNDKVNPPSHSKMIANAFKLSTTVHLAEHEFGHVLPLDKQNMEIIYSKLLK
jgi:predicted esterase